MLMLASAAMRATVDLLIVSLRHTAQQAQPSAPQNDFRSVIGSLLDHALAWSWPWTLHACAQSQLIASLRRSGRTS